MSSRRDVITALGLASAAAFAAQSASAQVGASQPAPQPAAGGAATFFWPNGARIAVSASLMLEAGGQNLHRSDALYGPMPEGYLDLPTNTWFEYGAVEGIPRLLDLFDRHGVKATSFMVGTAAEKHPDSRARSCGAAMKPPPMGEPGRARSSCRGPTRRRTSPRVSRWSRGSPASVRSDGMPPG
jgi:hypothetical protein